jgi:hypothetical protein
MLGEGVDMVSREEEDDGGFDLHIRFMKDRIHFRMIVILKWILFIFIIGD